MDVTYRGVTTKRVYRWVPSTAYAPAASLDANGNPVAYFTYLGETLILTNRDGSIARGVRSGNNGYGPGVQPSLWEQK